MGRVSKPNIIQCTVTASSRLGLPSGGCVCNDLSMIASSFRDTQCVNGVAGDSVGVDKVLKTIIGNFRLN